MSEPLFRSGHRALTAALLVMATMVCPPPPSGWGYPLDGYGATGIARLEGYRQAPGGKIRGRVLPSGAFLTTDQVALRLRGHSDLELPKPDIEFTAQIRDFLGEEADRYGFSVLDLSDLSHPRYAEHRGQIPYNPGSVGKLAVALALFQALADLYPDDLFARSRVLRTTMVTADRFSLTDEHKVPFWDEARKKIVERPIAKGDRASLWTYLDWTLSASSNAAASMVLKEAMLMVHFKAAYPVSEDSADRFLKETPKKHLTALLRKTLQDALTRNGLDLKYFRQGGFFTWMGRTVVPGVYSRGTSRELMRFLLRLEQGRLVDPYSSEEMKRLLYLTRQRIRYAASPALEESALYFKSGSLYSCTKNSNVPCEKYKGDVVNMMNSVAIVESPAENRRLYYMTVLMSNVLGKNSAVAHQTFATRLHRLIERFHGGGKGAQAQKPSGK
ncbi:MAG: serine hydrolase [bacterium]|nr:serine hydrolase [bacterium]